MRVVVTRPHREAQAWVDALLQHGFEVLKLPLIRIEPVRDTTQIAAAWRDLARYAAVMFVSGSAVHHFFAQRVPAQRELVAALAPRTRAWATGPGTSVALLRQGVEAKCIDAPASDSDQFDSEALWDVVGARVRSGDRVLIVRGTDGAIGDDMPARGAQAAPSAGRDWLARRLVLAGASVEFLAVYRRAAPILSADDLARARHASGDGSIWLFSSTQAVANLRSCLPQQQWAGARAVATHARIAEAARAAGFGVVWESRPSVSDIVSSIESIA